MEYKDGIYMVSVSEDDEIGPPQPGEEEDEELDLTPMGRIRLKGDTVENLDDNEDIGYLLESAFKREHRQSKGVSSQHHIPISNGEKGFGQAFMEMLGFLDYWYDYVGS